MDGVNVLLGELVPVEAVQPMQMRLSCARRLARLSNISTQVKKRPPSYLQVCGRNELAGMARVAAGHHPDRCLAPVLHACASAGVRTQSARPRSRYPNVQGMASPVQRLGLAPGLIRLVRPPGPLQPVPAQGVVAGRHRAPAA